MEADMQQTLDLFRAVETIEPASIASLVQDEVRPLASDVFDLFGDTIPAADKKKRDQNDKPQKPRRTPPVVDGGMFGLNDVVNPERFSAVFSSGASAHYDALALAEIGADIGVVAGLVRPYIAFILRQHLRTGGKLFVDSGAYGQREDFDKGKAKTPVVDFASVFRTYRDLMIDVPRDRLPNLAIVMPDVLKDLDLSLQLLQQHRNEVLEFIATGANVIVPVQRGATRAGRTVEIIKEILGTSDFTVGIPSASAAMPLDDAATIRNHHRFHVLGRGAMGMPLFQRTYALLEHNPGATVSCDANQIRSHTPIISYEQRKLIEQNEGRIWEVEYDRTELLHAVLNDSNVLGPKNVRAIAAFYGVTDPVEAAQWVHAHRSEEGLSALIEAIDPGASMLYAYGLTAVFREDAEKHLSARMRQPAVVKVFSDTHDDDEVGSRLPSPGHGR
jgi:hypothetical protein